VGVAVSVVQTASSSATATSLTVTFGSAVTPGSTLCLSLGIFDANTPGFTVAVELGSSPDNWGLNRKIIRGGGSSNYYAGAWSDANTAISGATTVTITLSGATGGFLTAIEAEVYEVAGLPGATQDITGALDGNGSSFTTGAFTPSASTAAADEFWWGCVSCGSSLSPAGPGSPWANGSLLTTSIGTGLLSGYQCTTATGSPLYDGTFSANGQWACAGATLKAGSAAGSASLSGAGTLGAAGGPAATASVSGDGEVTAAGTSAPPDSAFPAGSGTISAAATLDIAATATLAGDGEIQASANPPVTVNVVNQWQGKTAQNPVFGPSLPGLASTVVPLTMAASVGGGSGVPTAGNWLFAICGWRQAPGAPPVTLSNVGDDTHAWWRPASPSTAAGLTRTAIWYQPNIGAITTVPARVYASPSGYVPGMAVLVIEVAGLGPWDFVTGLATNYSASTGSLTLSVTL
jgi:hypothetical protein